MSDWIEPDFGDSPPTPAKKQQADTGGWVEPDFGGGTVPQQQASADGWIEPDEDSWGTTLLKSGQNMGYRIGEAAGGGLQWLGEGKDRSRQEYLNALDVMANPDSGWWDRRNAQMMLDQAVGMEGMSGPMAPRVVPQIAELIRQGKYAEARALLADPANDQQKPEGQFSADEWLRETGQDIATNMRQKAEANQPNVPYGSAKYYTGAAIEGVGSTMIPATAAAFATRGRSLIPGLATMGAQIFGQSYAQSRADGLDPVQAQNKAVFDAVVEMVSEKIPLGILTREGGKFIPRVIKSGAAEGIQEMVTEAMQMGYEWGVLDQNTPPDQIIRRLLDAGIIGAIGGSGMAVATHPFTRGQNQESQFDLSPVQHNQNTGAPDVEDQGDIGTGPTQEAGAEQASGVAIQEGAQAVEPSAPVENAPQPVPVPGEQTGGVAAPEGATGAPGVNEPIQGANGNRVDQLIQQGYTQPYTTQPNPGKPPNYYLRGADGAAYRLTEEQYQYARAKLADVPAPKSQKLPTEQAQTPSAVPGAPAQAQQAPVEQTRMKAERATDIPLDQVVADRRVADMSMEELRDALLKSELTGIPNRRAFIEAEKKPVRTSDDVDSLKAINDTFGHQAGDALLNSVARAYEKAGIEAYHISGDEFITQYSSQEDYQAKRAKFDKILSETKLYIDGQNGQSFEFTPGVSHGSGPTLTEAETGLHADKQRREEAGARAPRGERPVGLHEVAAEPGPRDDAADSASGRGDLHGPPQVAPTQTTTETPPPSGVSASGDQKTQPAKVDEAPAVAILDKAGVTGKDRLEILAKFRSGEYSLADIEQAYPEKKAEAVSDIKEPVKSESGQESDASTSGAGKIEDFGEVLHGARKHYAQSLSESLKETFDLATEPLSKSFPKPNYTKLSEAGVSSEGLAYIALLRDSIPQKPRKSYKVKSWARHVENARALASDIMEGKYTPDEMNHQIHVRAMSDLNVASTVPVIKDLPPELMEKAAQYRVKHGEFGYLNGQRYNPPKSFWYLTGPTDRAISSKGWLSGNWDYSVNDKYYESQNDIEEIAKKLIPELLKAQEAKTPAKKSKYTQVDVYKDRFTGERFLGFKVRSTVIRLKGGFDSLKEAVEYREEHKDEIQQKIDEMRAGPNMRGTENRTRQGENLRDGDVSPEMFSEAFGFRGVQFGNYVEGPRRQADLNRAYDALMDLADVVGIPPAAISLNGSLGLAFGARGRGGKNPAAAHYEPGTVVINLTKAHGAGSLAHEWLHATDNYFAKQDETVGKKYMSERQRMEGKVRDEVYQAWKEFEKAITTGTFSERSAEYDKARTKPYYGTTIEKAARAFERYVVDKMADKGAVNDYLANVDLAGGAYPTSEEMAEGGIRAALDKLFDTIETKQTDKGVAMYSRPDFYPTERKGGKSTKGMTPQQVEGLIAREVLSWGQNAPDVNVLADAEALPYHLQPSDGGPIQGVHDPSSGTVYLIADQLHNPAEVMTVLAHEAVGHYALEEMLGDSLMATTIKRVHWLKAQGNERILAASEEVRKQYPDLTEAVEAKEIIARLAEQRALKSTLGKLADSIINAVRQFLKKIGFKVMFTDKDIEASLARAEKWLQKDAGKRKHREQVLFHKKLGEIDLVMGKEGAFGASRFVQEHPEIGADLWKLVADADLVEETKTRATLQNDDVTFDLVKKGDKWQLTDASSGPNYARKANTQEGSQEALDDIGERFRKAQEARPTFKQWLAKKKEDIYGAAADARRPLLALLTRQQLAEVGQDTLPMMKQFEAMAREQDTRRNTLVADAADLGHKWMDLSKKNPDAADATAVLMHDTTIEGVDPSIGKFVPLIEPEEAKKRIKVLNEHMRANKASFSTRNTIDGKREVRNYMQEKEEIKAKLAADVRREEAYDQLVKRYNALPKEFQSLYKEVRDLYANRHTMVKQALAARILRVAERAQLNIEALQVKLTEAATVEEAKKIERQIKAEKYKAKKAFDMAGDIRLEFDKALEAGPYFPLARFGDYWVSVKKEGAEKSEFYMFEKSAEQKRFIKEAEKAGLEVVHGKKLENIQALAGASESFVADVMGILEEKGGTISDQIADSVYQLYLTTLPELSVRKNFIHRRKTKGYNQDALRAFADQTFHGSYHLARLEYSDQLRVMLDDAKKKLSGTKNPELASDFLTELTKRFEWMQNPQSAPWASKLTSFGFFWYLGITPAAAFVNLTQTPLVAFPILGARFGAVNSTGALLKTSREFMSGLEKGGFKDKMKAGFFSLENSLKGEELAALKEAIDRGAIDKTRTHDLIGMAESPSKIYSSKWHTTQEIIGYQFHHAERMNREVTFVAAYRLAREQGMSHADAVDLAADLTWRSHGDYSNSNRARILQSNTARVIALFRQYSQFMTFLMVRNVQQSLKGKDAQTRAIARKELTGILGMTALFAGASGLPMWWMVEMIMNALFDDEDDPWDFNTEFANWLHEKFGDTTAQAIMQGPIDALLGTGFHGRVGLNDLWFRDSGKELEGKGAADYWLVQMWGPLGGIPGNIYEGVKRINEGHVMRGWETMLPKFAKDGLKAWRFADEGVRTLRGDPVMEDTTLAQEAMQFLGMTPGDLVWSYEKNRSLRNYVDRIDHRRTLLMNRFALAYRTGDRSLLADVKDEIAAFNKANPRNPIRPKDLGRSIRQRNRISGQTENGIYLNKRERPLRDRVQFGEE